MNKYWLRVLTACSLPTLRTRFLVVPGAGGAAVAAVACGGVLVLGTVAFLTTAGGDYESNGTVLVMLQCVHMCVCVCV